jgi:hypothetical protein
LNYPNIFSREERTGCLSAVQTFVSTTPLALEPNLRTNLDPAGLYFVVNHSHSQQQPRKPTGNSLFSHIRTRIVIHETTGSLPCAAVAERVS